MRFNILKILIILSLIITNAFATNTSIDLGTAKINVNIKDWQYYISTVVFDKEVPLLKSLKIDQLRGTINSKLDILKQGKKIIPSVVIKSICDNQKEILKLAKNKTAKFSLKKSKRSYPMCIINDTDKLGSKTFVIFITRRTGKTGLFSYMTHTFTFNYPTSKRNESRKEINKLFKNIEAKK